MAPDMSADTGLGASGCALGNHTWKGTAPAFDPKPTKVNMKTSARTSDGRWRAWTAMAAKVWPEWAARIKKPIRIIVAPTWVRTAYHVPALRDASLAP